MQAVLEGFATIGLVIGLGALIGHLGLVDLAAQRVLTTVAFFVASPALLLTMLSKADIPQVFSGNLISSCCGVLAAVAVYALADRLLWRHDLGDSVIGALASGYVNAGNLGVPIAVYVLGDASYVAPTLLLQLLFLQPIALAILDAQRPGSRTSVRQFVRRAATNPLTVGSLIGVVLALGHWTLPRFLWDPLELVGNMAVPMVLVAYGVSLRLGPRFGAGTRVSEVAALSAIKLLVQPLAAYLIAHFALGLDGPALLAVVVTSALPTAQNIFVHATRYRRQETLACDTILVTTIGSVPVILLNTLLLT
ncbi:MAG: AEC family transporter [Micrococcales bacterium]|nr:AEC family transporter [Micrococcales bacterium]